MSKTQSPTAALARLITILPLAAAAALACSDIAGPVAPDEAPAAPAAPSPSAEAAGAVQQGTSSGEFKNVYIQQEGFGIAVKFDYAGAVTPSFTLGTGPDVLATQKTSVPAKKQAAGYWTAKIGGLAPGTQYYFRLDNIKSTWQGQAKTLRRQIVVDMDSIYVVNDGDWGWNCGDIRNRAKALLGPWSILSPGAESTIFTNDHCAHTGSTIKFPGRQPVWPNATEGTNYISNFPQDTMYLINQGLDVDGCVDWAVNCGPMALSHHGVVDVRSSGTTKVKITTKREDGTSGQTRLNLVWYYTIVVSFKDPDYIFYLP